MESNDDPLWYDRVEPDEPMNVWEMALIAIFAVSEFIIARLRALLDIFKAAPPSPSASPFHE